MGSTEDEVHEGSGHYESCISRTGGDDGIVEVHLMTSEVDAGSGDDYEHNHTTFTFGDGDVSNCRYHRTVCMHRRLLMAIRLLK